MDRSQSPFPGQDSEPSLIAIDPSLICSPTYTTPSTNSSGDANTSPASPDIGQSAHTSPAVPLNQLSSAPSEAHSLRTELLTSQPSLSPQNHPSHPYAQHVQRPPHLPRPSTSLRQRPYSHKGRRPGPTSAPSSAVLADGSAITEAETEKYIYNAYQDQTTLVQGILVHLDALTRQCEDMRTFIRTGFGEGYEFTNDVRNRVERARLELRNWNRTHVTELREILQPMPRLDDASIPLNVPCTGGMVQQLDHAEMTRLLDLYDLPFVPTMFLFEKKAVYLRFVGASRALMHRVLDERREGPTS